MAKKGSESIVVRRPVAATGAPDDFYGREEAELSAVAVIERCILWPRASSSESERGTHTIDGLHVFAPPDEITWAPGVAEEDQELRPEDQVTARFEEWRLDGAVGDWRKKRGNRVGFMFELRRWV